MKKPDSKNNELRNKPTSKLTENEDFYIDENGFFILTQKYLEKRGSCCKLGCRHCPYGMRETNELQK